MASPSTRILRSGGGAEASRFSGGGALENSSRGAERRGASCRNGANRSLPNQPLPPRCCGIGAGGRCGAPKLPKLKNCADAGPAMPTNSAIATVSATSGPLSLKMRRKDFFGFGIRSVANEGQGKCYNSRFGPQAGGRQPINRASGRPVKAAAISGLAYRFGLPPAPIRYGFYIKNPPVELVGEVIGDRRHRQPQLRAVDQAAPPQPVLQRRRRRLAEQQPWNIGKL